MGSLMRTSSFEERERDKEGDRETERKRETYTDRKSERGREGEEGGGGSEQVRAPAYTLDLEPGILSPEP